MKTTIIIESTHHNTALIKYTENSMTDLLKKLWKSHMIEYDAAF